MFARKTFNKQDIHIGHPSLPDMRDRSPPDMCAKSRPDVDMCARSRPEVRESGVGDGGEERGSELRELELCGEEPMIRESNGEEVPSRGRCCIPTGVRAPPRGGGGGSRADVDIVAGELRAEAAGGGGGGGEWGPGSAV